MLICGYLLLNAVFAAAYVACGAGALSGGSSTSVGSRFGQAFFFRVHTLDTIGYGNVVPTSLAANLIVTLETMVGPLGFGLSGGLLFAA